jgi:hypothetical protein
MSRTQPQLDAPVAPFRLVDPTGGEAVGIDHLVNGGPAVLAVLDTAPAEDPRSAMLRELGDLVRGSAAELVLVSPPGSPLGRALAADVGRWLTDPRGEAGGALGLAERRKLRSARRHDGLFVVDQERILRFSFVAREEGQWIPAPFVASRLSRLAATSESATAARRQATTLAAEQDEVEALARSIGGAMGLAGTELTQLATACRFRDLGMAAIPDEIIAKSEPLTDAEWDVVRTHPQRSAEMLGPSPLFAKVREMVRATHEHMDGSGYPDGLAGEAIPLGARIILLAESYVSLKRLPGVTDPVTELREGSGTMFDPRILDVLAAVTGRNGSAAAPSQG